MLALPPNAESTLLTSSGAVSAVPGQLLGFYVASTSSGTIVIKDGGSGGTALTGTITPAAGGVWHFLPLKCKTDIYATLANTISVTFVWVPR